MNFSAKRLMELVLVILIPLSGLGQTDWPREIPLETGGTIILYQLQPEKLTGNHLQARAALSIRKRVGDEPVFGAIWINASLNTDKDKRLATLEDVQIKDVKFPEQEQSRTNDFRSLLQQVIPRLKLEIALDELVATLDGPTAGEKDQFKNDPPEIIYTQQPTALVLIDGNPLVKPDDELKMNRVQNSPFLLVQNPDDDFYYLYMSPFWYQSTSVTEGWAPIRKLPTRIKRLNKKIQKQETENRETDNPGDPVYPGDEPATLPPTIVVRTKPVELIQTEGTVQFAPIEGTSLLYAVNTNDNLFMDIPSQSYFVTLSGRWYKTPSLNGQWTYVSSDALPADFARIPEGSPQSDVLAYVPGTEAAREAVMETRIPQTAKVDRKKATCQVTYDGDPRFEPVEGTRLYLAVNASGTVLRFDNRYFCVENGVWFTAASATGPWMVSTERPSDVDRIPPSNPAFPVKYVYIYDTNPDYVYMGYTAGYLGCYVYGPTIVYGTGYYYNPWYGRVYFPRPITWGLGLHYNPWTGWQVRLNPGWFNIFINPWPYFWGWSRPHLYRPPNRSFFSRNRYNYRNPGPRGRIGARTSGIGPTSNIYRYRNDVLTQDAEHSTRRSERPAYQPPTETAPAPARPSGTPPRRSVPSPGRGQKPVAIKDLPNDVYSDRSGNAYQRDQTGNWQQRDGKSWKPSSRENNPALPQLQRDHTLRIRSNERVNTLQRQQPAGASRSSRPALQPRSPRTAQPPH